MLNIFHLGVLACACALVAVPAEVHYLCIYTHIRIHIHKERTYNICVKVGIVSQCYTSASSRVLARRSPSRGTLSMYIYTYTYTERESVQYIYISKCLYNQHTTPRCSLRRATVHLLACCRSGRGTLYMYMCIRRPLGSRRRLPPQASRYIPGSSP